jgi:hypothetical protein
MLAGVLMGIGLGLPTIFLTTFAASLGIGHIAVFFWVYAPTAILVRLAMRRFPESISNTTLIVVGLLLLVISFVLFLPVHALWHLALPAVVMGSSHALLFPTVTTEGSGRFPARYRGIGTTLILGMFDLGNLVGSPLVGSILRVSRRVGFPAYPTMFLTVCLLLAASTVLFVWLSHRERLRDVVRQARCHSKTQHEAQVASKADDSPSSLTPLIVPPQGMPIPPGCHHSPA